MARELLVSDPGRSPSGAHAEHGYIVRLIEQRHDWQAGPEPHERLLREGQTLQALKKSDFPQATPEFICLVVDDESQVIGMIETVVPGSSLDTFKGRSTLRSIAARRPTSIEWPRGSSATFRAARSCPAREGTLSRT